MGRIRTRGRYLLTAGLFFLMVSPLRAQENTALKRNAIYFETFGQGGLYSFNYDYRVREEISIRAGFTSWGFGIFENEFHFTGFPVMVNYLSGKRYGHLEAGLGCLIATLRYQGGGTNPFFVLEGSGSTTKILGTATLGYRFQPPKGGFIFRVGLTPFFTNQVKLSAGASVGIGF